MDSQNVLPWDKDRYETPHLRNQIALTKTTKQTSRNPPFLAGKMRDRVAVETLPVPANGAFLDGRVLNRDAVKIRKIPATGPFIVRSGSTAMRSSPLRLRQLGHVSSGGRETVAKDDDPSLATVTRSGPSHSQQMDPLAPGGVLDQVTVAPCGAWNGRWIDRYDMTPVEEPDRSDKDHKADLRPALYRWEGAQPSITWSSTLSVPVTGPFIVVSGSTTMWWSHVRLQQWVLSRREDERP